MKRTYAVVASLAVIAAAGCSSGSKPASKPVDCAAATVSQQQWIDHCATGQLASTTSPSAISYSDPTKMLAKLNAAGFQCANDYPGEKKPTRDAVGVLRLPCSHGAGDNGEIDLMTFPNPAAKLAEQKASTVINRSVAYWSGDWGVAAPTRKLLGQVVVILES